jgi:5-(carboxyamino)imidazole ribonucleotide synthase
VILPGATVGVLGGGQLGRMFTLRARSMGYHVVVLDPDPLSPAGHVADRHIRAAYTDEPALDQLARACAAVTVEFENVPAEALERLARDRPVRPPGDAVAVAQDRIAEKTFLRDAGFPTAPFRAVRQVGELEAAFDEIGSPALLKTSRLGYDGKSQAPVADLVAARAAFERFGGVACVLEQRLELEAELSVVLARGADGAVAPFPAGENTHRDGILETTVVPARVPEGLAEEARALAIAVAERMAYVGVLGVELFVANGGRLFVNEMAPRPHNSGHYSIDACDVSQFELQVRTLTGLPLVQPRQHSFAIMLNLLGDLWFAGGGAEATPPWEKVLALPGAHLHLYGKTSARAGRKMGHLTLTAPTLAAVRQTSDEAARLLHIEPIPRPIK